MSSTSPPHRLPGAGETSSLLARLFVGRHAEPAVRWFSLPGGQALYRAGEPADSLYFLRAGRLGVMTRSSSGPPGFLGVIRPGDPVGEMALIAGTPHSTDVLAMRDSEILALPRTAFFAAARRDSLVMAELARLMILRAREGPLRFRGDPTSFGFVGLFGDAPIRPFVEAIEREVRRLGVSVALVGAEALHAPTEWFSDVEQNHEVVLLVAEKDEEAWTHLCVRQIDRLFLVGRGERRPPMEPSVFAGRAMHENRLIDLILLHGPDVERPSDSAIWLDAAPFSRMFHVKDGRRADMERLARIVTGRSVGLVLSGGGARAYAHLGAIRALREANQPIDFIGGASMGAIVGAGFALLWSQEAVEAKVRTAFVDSSPLSDIALPMIAMSRGRLVAERLRAAFGDVQIEDMWLPFFCVSSDLTHGDFHLHKRGGLARALRASSSLPGVLPPVIDGDSVLVDGAVTNNMPSDVMRQQHRGTVVAIDVAEAKALTPKDVETPPSIWRWLLSGDWRKGPPIVSLLIRAATVSSQEKMHAASDCDLLVAPKIEGVELRDWKAYDVAVAAGHRSMVQALAQLDRPLTELCRPDEPHHDELMMPHEDDAAP